MKQLALLGEPPKPTKQEIERAVLQADRLRRIAEADLFVFCDKILHVPMSLPLHRKVCDFLMRPTRRKLLGLPREHKKTAIATIGMGIWGWIKDNRLRTDITSGALHISRAILDNMRRQIESAPLLRACWPGLFWETPPENHWNRNELMMSGWETTLAGRNEMHFTASSIDKEATGFHFNRRFNDDLMNKKNAETRASRAKVWDDYEHSQQTLEAGGQEINVFTRWGQDDPVGIILDKMPEVFDTMILGLYDGAKIGLPEGSVLMPEIFTPEEIKIRRAFLSDFKWSCQYLNNPIEAGATPFKREWFARWTRDGMPGTQQLPDALYPVGAVDMSQGRDEGDYTCIMVGAYGPKGELYLLDCVTGHLGSKDTSDVIFAMQEKWKVQVWGLEKYALERMLFDVLRTEMQRRGVFLTTREVSRPAGETSKEQHILSLQGRYQTGMIFHPVTGFEAYEEQMALWPFTPNDDMADTAADLLLLSPGPMIEEPRGKDYSSMRDGNVWEAVDRMVGRAREDMERRTNGGYGKAHFFRSLGNRWS